MNVTVVQTLDLKGLSCPLPIAKTARALKTLVPGDAVEVFTTDPGSVPDFAAWSTATGNTLVEQSEEGGVFRFVILKG